MEPISVIFFDLGDTLGVPIFSHEGRLERFEPFGFVKPVLESLRSQGLRLGVISNTGEESGVRVNELLRNVGLIEPFEAALLVYSKDVGLKKDSPQIFRYAAALAGLGDATQQCLFVGEDARERGYALDAGMRVCPHPLLISEVLSGQALRYARIEVPAAKQYEPWREDLQRRAIVPLHVEGPGGFIVYILTSQRVVAELMNAQFVVTLLGEPDTPLRTELYLLRDDEAHTTGFLDVRGETPKLFANEATARAVLRSEAGKILVALPPEVTLESIHFEHAQHGHTLRLMPDPHLLDAPPGPPELSMLSSTTADAAVGPILSQDELATWSVLNGEAILDRVKRYSGQESLQLGSSDRVFSRHVAHPGNARAVAALSSEVHILGQGRLQVRLHQFSHQGLSLHNIVAELPGQSPELVLVTAHLDSTAISSHPFDPPSDPAPGADDDMSGVAAVLAIADRFLALSASVPAARTVQFVLFNDEENGLVGSKAYARQLRSAGTKVVGVFQMDMIGYNRALPREWEIHVGFSPSDETEARSLPLAELMANVTPQVSPGLPRPQIYRTGSDVDPAEQRSDHAPFQAQGYGACVVSEDFFLGPEANDPQPQPNPNYHKKEDTFIDPAYAADIARAVGTAAWVMANGRFSHAPAASFDQSTSPPQAVMRRELDTRKEANSLLGKRLVRQVPAQAALAVAPLGILPGASPSSQSLVDKALAFVQRQPNMFGFAAGEAAEFVPDPTVQRTSSGAAAVHLQQYHRGIPVFQMARTVRFSAGSEVIDAAGENTAFPTAVETEPVLSAVDAVRRVTAHLATTGGEMEKDEFGQESRVPVIQAAGYEPEVLATFNLPSRPTVLSKGPFEKPVPAHLVVFMHPTGPRLAWHVVATFPNYEEQYVVLVSADSAIGEILYSVSTLHRMRARGNVFELSPGLKARQIVDFPRPISDYPDMPAIPLAGFPVDWVENGKTIGNSTRATLGFSSDTLEANVQNGVATFEPQNESGDDQKLLNIFYFCNYMHDFLFLIGFDEAAGNFQEINFTHTGLSGDPVQARAHPGTVRGTANMATFPDGQPPIMNMGLVAGVNRHTAFDADVVFHEYTHGLTNRLVGGRINTSALDEPQSRGMGEGWSDYYALTIVSYVIGREKVVTGDWVVNRAQGIRRAPYDDSYPFKFSDIVQLDDEHDVGEIWCAALMMMTRKVRQAMANDQDGYRLSWQIVTDGLKLTPANPSFLDARDAILLALDQLKNVRKISAEVHSKVRRAAWEAFAHFGMGVNASSNGPSLNGVVGDATLPADLHARALS
jgi:hypothetical protein